MVNPYPTGRHKRPVLWILKLHLPHKTDSSLVKIAQFEESRWQATPRSLWSKSTKPPVRELVVEDDITEGAVYMNRAVVVNEARLSEPLRK